MDHETGEIIIAFLALLTAIVGWLSANGKAIKLSDRILALEQSLVDCLEKASETSVKT